MYRSRYLGRLTAKLVRKQVGGNYRLKAVRCLGTKDYDKVIPGVRHEYGSLGDMPMPSRRVSWQAEHNQDIQNVTQKALIYEMTQQQSRTIEQVVPWFLENMPESYFRQIPENFRMSHVKAISAVKDADMDLHLNLQAHMPDGRKVLTFIRPGTQAGTLLKMIMELPYKDNDGDDYMPLTRLHVFSTEDETMSLNMFVYGLREATASDVSEDVYESILDYASMVQRGEVTQTPDGLSHPSPSPLFEHDRLVEYIKKCSQNYINFGLTNPRRFLQQMEMFNEVSGSEGTAIHIEPDSVEPNHFWVDVAVANSYPRVALEHLCRLLFLHDFDVARARLDVVPDGDNGNITMLRMLVTPIGDNTGSSDVFDVLTREIKRCKWLDPLTMDLVFDRYPWLGVTRGEIITALCNLMHPILYKEHSVIYTKANIFEAITKERFIDHSAAIASLFLDRFNPRKPFTDFHFDERVNVLRDNIQAEVEDSLAVACLLKMIDIVKHTLKTNVYLPNRYALSMRLDPTIMPADEGKEIPFGVFFVHGRRFNAFHTRFRDISRGGMRIVSPRSPEQQAVESARHYDECYGLAFAQQLKNKDIPEGGSKAVNLVDVNGMTDHNKNFVMRKSVKAFTDSILDLIVQTEETRNNVVDYYNKPEVLYLGPDEQIIPEDINWIVKRAEERGYPTPAAFMSSKPRAGINHKEYGVTSEGVNVFLDVGLRRVLGIDPTAESFTIKITGGPDGDVAGNEIKILVREYGENAKIVGLADASGCAEDPDGLDHEELLRLVRQSKSISEFNMEKLGPNGVLHTCDTTEGTKARNSMHNRVVSDAFVPCGGRPNTIDMVNYKNFFLADGTPSSKLIVEGANIFITSEARKALHDEGGVMIIKDSSANKGGVITSSYEICAAMLLSEDEFFKNKKQIVEEVLEKLRTLAKLEATLLLREYETFGGTLPETSQIISNCINRTTDALGVALETLPKEDRELLLPLFRAHLPKTLADLSFDQVHSKVPEAYIKNAIASCLASKLVYKEGTKFIDSLPPKDLAKIALKYIKKENEIMALIQKLEGENMTEEEKEKIIALLEAGGARTALGSL
uniref:Glutamate/phenylalanine/leucine/valine/L-tryptophan dehydrogenase C-terminal domain-containing protein n=1 Tax=Amphora coffeiformis TaxID=265554 RepID=A0A7S3KZB4_9STRA